MRVHIALPDTLVRDLDRRLEPRGRTGFIVRAIERALDDERRWEEIQSAMGSISDEGHDWDDDAAAWVREQRRPDSRRMG